MTAHPCSRCASDGVLNIGLYLLVGGREQLDVFNGLGRRDVDVVVELGLPGAYGLGQEGTPRMGGCTYERGASSREGSPLSHRPSPRPSPRPCPASWRCACGLHDHECQLSTSRFQKLKLKVKMEESGRGNVHTSGFSRAGSLLAVPAEGLLLLVDRHELAPGVLASLPGAALDVDEVPVDAALLRLQLGDNLHEQARLFWMLA